MNKTQENKRSLTTSAIVLLLCIVALIGVTTAWFTSTASNTGNRIQAGTLKVDLLMDKTLSTSQASDYISIAGGSGDIFKEASVAQNSNITLWEPGKTQVVYLAVENKGNLALKYTAYIDVIDEGLVGSLEYALFDEGTYAKMQQLAPENWTALKAAATVSGDVAAGRSVISTGVLDEITKGTQNERDYVALAVHMKETAGNEYQGKDCVIDVTISAAQLASENDGFGTNTYDVDAEGEIPPAVATKTIVASKDTVIDCAVTPANKTGQQTTVTFPKDIKAFADNPGTEASLTVEATPILAANHKFVVSSNGAVGAIDLEIKVNGTSVSEFKDSSDAPVAVTVVTYVAKGLSGVTLQYNNGTGVQPTDVTYDSTTGKLTFKTTHFSTFVLGANEHAYVTGKNTAYATLAAAITAAGETNDTIVMLRDVSYTNPNFVMRNVNLNLNTYKVFINRLEGGPWSFSLFETVTISNGTVEASLFKNSQCAIYANKGANATLNNVNVKAYRTSDNAPAYGAAPFGGYAQSPNGNLIINGGTFDSIITTNGSTRYGSLTINDGVFNEVLYLPAYMTYNINGGTFKKCLEFRSGFVNISGGTFMETGEPSYDWTPQDNGFSGCSVGVVAFNGVIDSESYGPTPVVTITGGTFAGKIALARVDASYAYPTVNATGVTVQTVQLGKNGEPV